MAFSINKSSQEKYMPQTIGGTPVIRRRSSSLDPSIIQRHRNLKKYMSNDNLNNLDNDNDLNINPMELNSHNDSVCVTSCINSTNNLSSNIERNIFYNWKEDVKLVKQTLFKLAQKADAANFKELCQQCFVFFICNPIKYDAECELYLVTNYENQIKDLIESSEEEKSPSFKEHKSAYQKIIEKIASFDGSSDSKESNEFADSLNSPCQLTRRNSESMALILTQKNQNLSQMYPLNCETMICKSDIDLVNMKSNSNNEYRGQGDIIISSHHLNILHKKKLKHHMVLKHVYCNLCHNPAIPNRDSCLQLVAPVGDEFYVRFRSPSEAADCLALLEKLINESIEENKLELKVEVFQETPPTTGPLKSKKLLCNLKTSAAALKEMAFKEFGITEFNLTELCLYAKSTQNPKQYQINDNVRVLMLLDHLKMGNESNDCNRNCYDGNNFQLNYRFYLRTINNTLNEAPKAKKTNKKEKPSPFVYNLSKRWPKEELPIWLLILIADLYNNSHQEGIFRIPGLASDVEIFEQSIKQSDDISIDCKTATKAGILKRFLWYIDNTLLDLDTQADYDRLCNLLSDTDKFYNDADLQKQFIEFINNLPPRNRLLMNHLLVLFSEIVANSASTKMTATDLGTCLGHSLFRKYTSKIAMEDARKPNAVAEAMIKLTDTIVDENTKESIVAQLKSIGTESMKNSTDSLSSSINSRNHIDESEGSSPPPPIPPPRLKRNNAADLTKYDIVFDLSKRCSILEQEPAITTSPGIDEYDGKVIQTPPIKLNCPFQRQVVINRHHKHSPISSKRRSIAKQSSLDIDPDTLPTTINSKLNCMRNSLSLDMDYEDNNSLIIPEDRPKSSYFDINQPVDTDPNSIYYNSDFNASPCPSSTTTNSKTNLSLLGITANKPVKKVKELISQFDRPNNQTQNSSVNEYKTINKSDDRKPNLEPKKITLKERQEIKQAIDDNTQITYI